MLTMVWFCCLEAKKNILHIFPLLERLHSWMLSIPWIPTHIALLLPPVFVEFMYLSPRWLQKIIFFLPVFKGKSGTFKPSFMLEFCLIAMSLHLSSKTLMLLSLPNPWKTCWRWFFIYFQDFISKSAGIFPFLWEEDLLLGLIVARNLPFWFQEEQRFLTGHSGLLDGSSSSLMNKSSWS